MAWNLFGANKKGGPKGGEPKKRRKRRVEPPVETEPVVTIEGLKPQHMRIIDSVHRHMGVDTDPVRFLSESISGPTVERISLPLSGAARVRDALRAAAFTEQEAPFENHHTWAASLAHEVAEQMESELRTATMPDAVPDWTGEVAEGVGDEGPEPVMIESTGLTPASLPAMREAPKPTRLSRVTEADLIERVGDGNLVTGDILEVLGQKPKRTYERWGGQRPPEYAEEYEGQPVSLDRLKRYYGTGPLHAGEARKVPEGRTVVGVYIELPPNPNDKKNRPTLVYHRFDDAEMLLLAEATPQQPLVIGRGPGDEGDIRITLAPQDFEFGMFNIDGEDERIAKNHVALWMEDGRVTVRNLDSREGVHVVASRPSPPASA